MGGGGGSVGHAHWAAPRGRPRRAWPGSHARGRAVWWVVRNSGVARFTEGSPLRMRRGGLDDRLAGVAGHGARRAPRQPGGLVHALRSRPPLCLAGGRGRGLGGGAGGAGGRRQGTWGASASSSDGSRPPAGLRVPGGFWRSGLCPVSRNRYGRGARAQASAPGFSVLESHVTACGTLWLSVAPPPPDPPRPSP